MEEGSGGVWEVTTVPLASDLYTYRYQVDGQTGLDPLNAFTRRDVGTVCSLVYVDGGAGDLYQVQDVPHGAIVTTWYHSRSTGSDRRMNIYLPASYDGKKRFPVLYLLHGSGNDENGWLELGAAARIMDNLAASGKIVPMIVVMPNGNIGAQAAPGETSDNLRFRPVSSDRIPNPYRPLTFEETMPEIVGYVDSHFKTIPKKTSRAVAGLSMGGGQTLRIGMDFGLSRNSTKRSFARKKPDTNCTGLKSARMTSCTSAISGLCKVWTLLASRISTPKRPEATPGATGGII